MTEQHKKKFKIDWNQVLVLLCVLFLGILIGQLWCLRYTSRNFSMLLSTDKTEQLLRAIQRQYVDSISIPMLEDVGIRAMLQKLDPHSVYIPASQASAATDPLEGSFSGVGLQYSVYHDSVVVVRVSPSGPAQKVGIIAGDRIVAVGDSLLVRSGASSKRVASLLKGKDRTKVQVTIARPGIKKRFKVDISRGIIPIQSIDAAYMIEKGIGFIRLNIFSKNTDTEFVAAIRSLKKRGMTKLILDLRDNSGGVMEAAIRVCDHFLRPGAMIVYAQGRTRPKMEIRATEDTLCVDLKLVLLINENSASASEIVAGAMQDNDRGIIVGRRSYGKGLIQEQMNFRDGSLLRLTVARYYTPTGRSIQKSYVNGSDEYYSELNNRMLHGEMLAQDSMKLNDTIKYVTPGGRIVYGGGGIYPDVFIPVDTTLISFYGMTLKKQLFSEFAFAYVDGHRKSLMGWKNVEDMEKHLSKTAVLEAFHIYLNNSSSITRPVKSLSAQANCLMERLLIAHIILNRFDEESFFRFFNLADRSVLKALEVLKGQVNPSCIALKK